MMTPFDFQPRTRVVFGENAIDQLGALAGELGTRRAMLVTDPGIVAAGHVERGLASLTACLLYTSPSPRDATLSRMPSSA